MDVVKLVPELVVALLSGLAPPPAACGVLKNGTQYNIQSLDGRYAVVDVNKHLAFLKSVSAADASKFVAVQKTCDFYGLCVNGICMSRCAGCEPDTGDYQTVKFILDNSDGSYSQWNLTYSGGVVGNPYDLQVDSFYLTYKTTPNGDDQLTLSNDIDDNSAFRVIEAN